jgi:hypothetical protein
MDIQDGQDNEKHKIEIRQLKTYNLPQCIKKINMDRQDRQDKKAEFLQFYVFYPVHPVYPC